MENGDLLLVLGSALAAFGFIALLSGYADRTFSRKGGLSFIIGLACIGLATLRRGEIPDFHTWAMATVRIISSVTGPL